MVRFYHKEMEAYLVAEGLFDDVLTEDGKDWVSSDTGCLMRGSILVHVLYLKLEALLLGYFY